MSETAATGDLDHRELVEWVAESSNAGSKRRLHRIVSDHDRDALTSGDPVDVECDTSHADKNAHWRARPAAVYPPGYRELCTDCFSEAE